MPTTQRISATERAARAGRAAQALLSPEERSSRGRQMARLSALARTIRALEAGEIPTDDIERLRAAIPHR